MKKILFVAMLLISFTTFKATAQTFPVPENYTLKVKEDYPKYEADVIKTVDWLQNAPSSEDKDKLMAANRFLVAWISGSPDITISITHALADISDKNPSLLMIYMGGYTKYVLQHKDDKNTLNAKVAGLRQVVAKYNLDTDHVKNSTVEKLAALDQKGKLVDWAASKLKE
ncbi:MAG: hypothetical protein ABI113_05745 [Mucilaginibacter sp.]